MTYFPGKWKAICDVCGFEYFNDELLDRWDGFKVCRKDWEPRHPQEFVRSVPESTVPWTRPEPVDIEIGPSYSMDNPFWELGYMATENPDYTFTWYIDPNA